MDRNSVIGFVLIGIILIGYSYLMQPSEAEIARMREKRDSIARVEAAQLAQQEQTKATQAEQIATTIAAKPELDSLTQANNDSLKAVETANKYGAFAPSATGQREIITLENEVLRLLISSKGGRVVSAELKDYQTFDSLPLHVLKDSTRFNLSFFSENRLINTEELYFEAEKGEQSVNGESLSTLTLTANTTSGKQLQFVYKLRATDYLVDFDVVLNGMEQDIAANASEIALNWEALPPRKERSVTTERNASTIYYKYKNDEIDYINEQSYELKKLEANVQWVSFKQQFFSAAIISADGFENTNADLETKEAVNLNGLKHYAANLTLLVDNGNKVTEPLQFYFGPNHYQTLKKIGLDLEEQIDLGWTIIGWINQILVIPVFNFLNDFGLNYGIIILILTIFIKLLLFPLTYRNFVSSAKMKVLKPEMDELNERHKDSDPMKKQQALMALYREAGVNPMAGCVPMLLQMPILLAMFKFFPASIELRQQSFLWADDLSSYDSIFSLPFEIPFYGDHVSLFTILMAISTFLYTKYNTQMTMTSGPQAAQMKIITYMMPVMLLFFFNSYSAGLSYYYFLANIVSVIQQLVTKRYFIDEEKIHAKIQANKRKPKVIKKSSFQKRLEEMAKKRGLDNPYNTRGKK